MLNKKEIMNIAVVGNPDLPRVSERMQLYKFTNGFTLTRDQQTLLNYAMDKAGARKEPNFVYAEAVRDSRGDRWKAIITWNGANWCYTGAAGVTYTVDAP